MTWPGKCVVDTNVPLTANLALRPHEVDAALLPCVMACVEAIEHVKKTKGLVLDAGDAIYDEYRNKLSLKGTPGLGDAFLKWVHDNRWSFPESDRVRITPRGDSYKEFPEHPGLAEFDRSDRKFVAVACAHPERPPILQATDSKWWGWKDALEEAGVKVQFLCSEYAHATWAKKMGA